MVFDVCSLMSMPRLTYRLDGFRPDVCLFGAGAGNREPVAGHVPEEALGHLAAGRVVGAEEQDTLLHGSCS